MGSRYPKNDTNKIQQNKKAKLNGRKLINNAEVFLFLFHFRFV